MLRKIFAIIILLSIISIQNSAFSAPAIRLGDDGVFEIYDDNDSEPSLQEEIVIQEPVKQSQEPSVIISNKSAQELEDEADYLKYKQSQDPKNYTSTKYEQKEPSKIKKVGGKIAEGIVTGVILTGVVAGTLFKSWLDSDDEDDDEQEEYCSKCKRYHKKHD